MQLGEARATSFDLALPGAIWYPIALCFMCVGQFFLVSKVVPDTLRTQPKIKSTLMRSSWNKPFT